MRELEKLSIISTAVVGEELRRGGSLAYRAAVDDDGAYEWFMRLTTPDGVQNRIITTTKNVRDRTFKSLDSLWTWHISQFGDGPGVELRLPTKPGDWSPEHHLAPSASK